MPDLLKSGKLRLSREETGRYRAAAETIAQDVRDGP
jgi:hypothetical protein